MASIFFTVGLALVAVLAGWLECFRKDIQPITAHIRRVTPAGWVVLCAIIGLTILNAIVTKHEQDNMSHDLAKANQALSSLRDHAIKTFNDDLTIRIWKAETDSIVWAFRFTMDIQTMLIESSANSLLTLQDIETSLTQDKATYDMKHQTGKKISQTFMDQFALAEKTLILQVPNLIASLEQRGAPITDASRAAIDVGLRNVSMMSNFLQQNQSEPVDLVQSSGQAAAAILRQSATIVGGCADLAVEAAYQTRLRSLVEAKALPTN